MRSLDMCVIVNMMDKNLVSRYIKTIVFSLIIFGLLSLYIYIRRGYFTFYIVNKVVAGDAIILLGIVLLIGPITRLYDAFDHFIIYRKELGIIAFLYAFIHGMLSLFYLPEYFSISSYLKHLNTFIPGLTGLIILALLFIFSFEFIIEKMDKKIWWLLQNWGVRVGGILIILHVVLMKYSGWVSWYIKGGGPELLRFYLPPAGLLVTSFGLLIGAIRISEFFGKNTAQKLMPIIVSLYVIFLGFTFGWGISKKSTPPQLDWVTCVKQTNSKIVETFPSTCVLLDGRRVTQKIIE